MNILSLLFSDPLAFFVVVVAFLITLAVHEASHALMGSWLGDQTAARMHRLTLNPFAHIDMLGFLALITIGFGWGKPVPFNPYNLKYQRWGPAFVAAAGPLSNLLFGALLAVMYRFLSPSLGDGNLLIVFLSYAAYLNFLLLLFNLIPIPPLDGSKALLAVLAAPQYAQWRMRIETQGPILLIGLIILDALGHLGIFSGLVNGATFLFHLFS